MIKIIAEIGWNHCGDMNLAKQMAKAAKKNGATYAKYQTWSVDRLKPGSWDEDGRREIYEKAELSEQDHIELIDYCDKIGINFLSSVFSIPDAELLVKLGCKEVKIPSFESRNHELIKYCVNNFDKIFISFGTCTLEEVRETATLFKKTESKFYPMHCVSAYPLNPKNANIGRINWLTFIPTPSGNWPNGIGYSDHMEGVESAKVAIEVGAKFIEKHFTTDKSLPGRDNKFACLPSDIKNLSDYIKLREDMMSINSPDYQSFEEDSRINYTGRFNG